MGAWRFIEPRLHELLPDTCVLSYAGRDDAASPAAGAFRMHQLEEKTFVERALNGEISLSRGAEPATSEH